MNNVLMDVDRVFTSEAPTGEPPQKKMKTPEFMYMCKIRGPYMIHKTGPDEINSKPKRRRPRHDWRQSGVWGNTPPAKATRTQKFPGILLWSRGTSPKGPRHQR